MVEKTNRLIEILKTYIEAEINSNYVLTDSIQFEFEKLYEDSTRLSVELSINHPELHIDDLRSIRNRVAHDYESVVLQVDTIRNDIPTLRDTLQSLLSQISESKKSGERNRCFFFG